MSFHYKNLIQNGSAYGIAKALQKKTYSPDHEDIMEILQSSLWMIDTLYDRIESLEVRLKTKQDCVVKP